MQKITNKKLAPQALFHQLTILALCAYALAIVEAGYDDLPWWKHLFGLFGFFNRGDY